jgi:hypothetical protein
VSPHARGRRGGKKHHQRGALRGFPARRRPNIRRNIFLRDEGRCWICGESVLFDPSEMTFDHVVPHSEGGATSIANLKLAHRKCNNERELLEREAQDALRPLVDEGGSILGPPLRLEARSGQVLTQEFVAFVAGPWAADHPFHHPLCEGHARFGYCGCIYTKGYEWDIPPELMVKLFPIERQEGRTKKLDGSVVPYNAHPSDFEQRRRVMRDRAEREGWNSDTLRMRLEILDAEEKRGRGRQ